MSNNVVHHEEWKHRWCKVRANMLQQNFLCIASNIIPNGPSMYRPVESKVHSSALSHPMISYGFKHICSGHSPKWRTCNSHPCLFLSCDACLQDNLSMWTLWQMEPTNGQLSAFFQKFTTWKNHLHRPTHFFENPTPPHSQIVGEGGGSKLDAGVTW